jgi:hypothetical protein
MSVPPSLDESHYRPRWRERSDESTKRRERKIRADRLDALNSPGQGDQKPIAVSLAEFRRLFGFSHMTVHRRIGDGTLKSFVALRRRMIPWSEVERLRRGE